jgi:hypothetical protein
MERYSFRQCTLTSLDRLFGLRQVFARATLDQWLQSGIMLLDYEEKTLHELRSLLLLNAPGWNEWNLPCISLDPC